MQRGKELAVLMSTAVPTYVPSSLTLSRASSAWDVSDAGVSSEVSSNVIRQNSTGVLIEGSYTNRITNPRWTGTGTFHTGKPPRVQPTIAGGVITGLTILDAGDSLTGVPLTIKAVGTGGSGFSVTGTIDGSGHLSGFTSLVGGSGYPAGTGMICVCGTVPTGWTATCASGIFCGLSIASLTTINGIPMLAVRFTSNDSNVYMRPTLSSSAVTAGQVVSQSCFQKLIAGSLTAVQESPIGFQETGGVQHQIWRDDMFLDYPNDVHFVEHSETISAAVTAISTTQYYVSGDATAVFDVTYAYGAPFLGVAPRATSPIMPAAGNTGATTRAADAYAMSSAEFASLFNSAGWAVAIDATFDHVDDLAERILWQMDDGTDNNRITVKTVSGTSAIVAEIAISGSVTATTAISRAIMPSRQFRALLTGAVGSLDLTVNGGATNAVSTTLPAPTIARQGNNIAASSPVNGRIKTVRFMKKQPTAAQKIGWSDPSVTFGAPVGSRAADDSFTMAFIPDAHVTASSVNEWIEEYTWIVNNKAAQNIVAVVGEGDVVTDAANSGLWSNEFDLAKVGWNAIDAAGTPYVIGIGNHDYDTSANMTTDRLATRFVSKLPLTMISGKSWYGDSYDGTMKNCWIKVDYGTRKFLILNLELWPDDTMLAWGLAACNANLDREVIFMTHSHMNPDGTQTKSTDTFGCGTKPYGVNDGPGVWAKLGKLAPNMKMIISGHQYRDNAAFAKTSYLLGTGNSGNRVHQMLCNYQTVSNGFGIVGLLRFHSTSGLVDFYAQSAISGVVDPDSVRQLVW